MAERKDARIASGPYCHSTAIEFRAVTVEKAFLSAPRRLLIDRPKDSQRRIVDLFL